MSHSADVTALKIKHPVGKGLLASSSNGETEAQRKDLLKVNSSAHGEEGQGLGLPDKIQDTQLNVHVR